MHLLFSLVILIIAGGLGFMAYRGAQAAKAAMTWPKVPGVVVESRIGEQRDTKPNETGQYEMNYMPVVRYDYEVSGVKHTGDHIGVGWVRKEYSSPAAAGRVLADYPLGKTIDVLVDPADAANAVLTPKATINMVLPIALAAVGIVVLFIPF